MMTNFSSEAIPPMAGLQIGDGVTFCGQLRVKQRKRKERFHVSGMKSAF